MNTSILIGAITAGLGIVVAMSKLSTPMYIKYQENEELYYTNILLPFYNNFIRKRIKPTKDIIGEMIYNNYLYVPTYITNKMDSFDPTELQEEDIDEIMKVLIVDYIIEKPTLANWIGKNMQYVYRITINIFMLGIAVGFLYPIIRIMIIFPERLIARNSSENMIFQIQNLGWKLLLFMLISGVYFAVIYIVIYAYYIFIKTFIDRRDIYSPHINRADSIYRSKLYKYDRLKKKNNNIILSQFLKCI